MCRDGFAGMAECAGTRTVCRADSRPMRPTGSRLPTSSCPDSAEAGLAFPTIVVDAFSQ